MMFFEILFICWNLANPLNGLWRIKIYERGFYVLYVACCYPCALGATFMRELFLFVLITNFCPAFDFPGVSSSSSSSVSSAASYCCYKTLWISQFCTFCRKALSDQSFSVIICLINWWAIVYVSLRKTSIIISKCSYIIFD